VAQPKHGASVRRRSRLVLLVAIVLSVAIVVAWFPGKALLHQRSALAAAQAQLATLHAQDAALARESRDLENAGEVGRIARQEYQLVSPGQQPYEVLPPADGSSAGTPYAGDPGVDPPSAPSAAAELPPSSSSSSSSSTSSTTTTTTVPPHAPHQSGLLSRMLHSLEFWR
jgi:cell division protein FtsB